jgi:hypothetical protein
MVLPHYGPFNKVLTLPGPPIVDKFGGLHHGTWLSRYQVWSRQKVPYTDPLPAYAQVLTAYGDNFYHEEDNNVFPCDINYCPPYIGSYVDDAVNKCFGKFVEAVGDASIWAVNLIEHEQTFGMIASKVLRLTRFTRKLNRFDIFGAGRELGVSVTSVKKVLSKKSKSLADLWLEFHFGWEPLVQDIGAAIKTLTSEPHFGTKVKVRANYKTGEIFHQTGGFPGTWQRNWDRYETYVSMSARLRVNNPNLFLAQQMGFINPLQVAWELIPFSFVVDWFANVGQILGSWTAFAGVEITAPCTSHVQYATRKWWLDYGKAVDPLRKEYQGPRFRLSMLDFRRATGIPYPVLKLAPWKDVSPVRGATAISLLVQQLDKIRR